MFVCHIIWRWSLNNNTFQVGRLTNTSLTPQKACDGSFLLTLQGLSALIPPVQTISVQVSCDMHNVHPVTSNIYCIMIGPPKSRYTDPKRYRPSPRHFLHAFILQAGFETKVVQSTDNEFYNHISLSLCTLTAARVMSTSSQGKWPQGGRTQYHKTKTITILKLHFKKKP